MLAPRTGRQTAQFHTAAVVLLASLSAAHGGRTLSQVDASPSPESPSPQLLGAPGPNGVPHGVLVYTTPPPADDTLSSTGPAATPVFDEEPALSPADVVNSISADDINALADSERSNKSWIAGVVIGVLLLLALVVGVCIIARRRRRAATRFHELQSTEMSFRDADF